MTAMQDDARNPANGSEEKPDSNGTNSRPRNDTISQTAPGIPDDSGQPIEVDPEEAERIEEKIRSM